MSAIWICESGEYEQRGIDFVCASVESGVAHLKAKYSTPYIVTWDEAVEERRGDRHVSFKVVGHFQCVIGLSSKHNCEFEFTEYEVLA